MAHNIFHIPNNSSKWGGNFYQSLKLQNADILQFDAILLHFYSGTVYQSFKYKHFKQHDGRMLGSDSRSKCVTFIHFLQFKMHLLESRVYVHLQNLVISPDDPFRINAGSNRAGIDRDGSALRHVTHIDHIWWTILL